MRRSGKHSQDVDLQCENQPVRVVALAHCSTMPPSVCAQNQAGLYLPQGTRSHQEQMNRFRGLRRCVACLATAASRESDPQRSVIRAYDQDDL